MSSAVLAVPNFSRLFGTAAMIPMPPRSKRIPVEYLERACDRAAKRPRTPPSPVHLQAEREVTLFVLGCFGLCALFC